MMNDGGGRWDAERSEVPPSVARGTNEVSREDTGYGI
jgi:hypothetical protein